MGVQPRDAAIAVQERVHPGQAVMRGGQRDHRGLAPSRARIDPVSYTHLRAHETVLDLVCRLLLDKKNTLSSIHFIT